MWSMTRWEARCWVCLLACCLFAAPASRAATFDELARQAAAAREADQVPQAIDLYRRALHLKPDWSEGWFYLGTLYYDSDRYADAQPAFAQFLKLADKPAGWAFLGLCEFETGAYTLAQEHLQKALDGGLAPEIEPVVRFHQTLLLTRSGLFDRAWHGYKAAVSRGIHDPALIAGLGLNSLSRPMLPSETPPIKRNSLPRQAGPPTPGCRETKPKRKRLSMFSWRLTRPLPAFIIYTPHIC